MVGNSNFLCTKTVERSSNTNKIENDDGRQVKVDTHCYQHPWSKIWNSWETTFEIKLNFLPMEREKENKIASKLRSEFRRKFAK